MIACFFKHYYCYLFSDEADYAKCIVLSEHNYSRTLQISCEEKQKRKNKNNSKKLQLSPLKNKKVF